MIVREKSDLATTVGATHASSAHDVGMTGQRAMHASGMVGDAGRRRMRARHASPLQAPNAEPIALAGEAWPRPYGDPTRGQLRRGEAMPRPPASNRGCPDPVSQVMNQHANLTK